MSLPVDLVFVRHGQSALNETFDKVLAGMLPDGEQNSLEPTQDAEIILTKKGEKQAHAAGRWLRDNVTPPHFDRYYCSPFYRTRQTAALLELGGAWRLDDRLREQDWAEFLTIKRDENRARHFPFSFERFQKSFWYWTPPNGENKFGDVRARISSWFSTLAREIPDETVIAVTHGGTISVVRFLIERLNFDEIDAKALPNCAILWYSRRNPTTGEISDSVRWRRIVCPWDESLSWDDGAWTELKLDEKILSDKQLLASVKKP
jgi:broad specificity phosphatase PhoE